MSNNDHIRNIGKTISVTASALMNSQNVSDTILSSNSPYKNLLKNTLADNSISGSSLSKLKGTKLKLNGDQKHSFQDIYSAKSGQKYFDNKFTNKRKSFQVLSYINDDILHDISGDESKVNNRKLLKHDSIEEEKGEPSLFEGFTATVATDLQVIDDKETSVPPNSKHISYSNNNSLTELTKNPNEPLLPNNIKSEEINKSLSISFLTDFYKNVCDNMDKLEIKKKITSTEINELDLKLKQLKVRRGLMFNRIVTLEENEFFLENNLNLIRDRINYLKEFGIDESLIDDYNDGVINETLTKIDQLNLEESPRKIKTNMETRSSRTLSDSTFSVDESVHNSVYRMGDSSSNRLELFFQPKNKKFRKASATLQQYYSSGTEIHSLTKAHDTSITSLDFDVPFGTMCTTGYMDYSIKVWDLSKYKQVGEMKGHLATINCMEMDTNYNMIVTGSKDASLKLWNLSTTLQTYNQDTPDNSSEKEDYSEASNLIQSPSCVHTFEAHVDEVTALSINSTNLISASQDRTIRNWDMITGKCVQTIDLNFPSILKHSATSIENTSSLTTVDTPITGALQSYDVALATGTKDGLVRLWDLRSGEVVRVFTGHTDAITSLKFDTKKIVTGSLDKSVRIWDLRMGTLFDAFAFESPVLSLDFDKKKIVMATNEGAVKIFNIDDGKHWLCEGNKTSDSLVQRVKYKDGYLIEGRNNGDTNVWVV